MNRKLLIAIALFFVLVGPADCFAQRNNRNVNSNSYEVDFNNSENTARVISIPKVWKGVRLHFSDRFKMAVTSGKVYYRINNSPKDSLKVYPGATINTKLEKGKDTLFLEVVSPGHKTFKYKLSENTPIAVAIMLEAI